MKPYVICHMLGSVDGRIKQNIWGLKDPHTYFEETAEKIKADAWLVGRVTMQEFSSRKTYALDNDKSLPKEDFVAQGQDLRCSHRPFGQVLLGYEYGIYRTCDRGTNGKSA